jgi:hypothetical protein
MRYSLRSIFKGILTELFSSRRPRRGPRVRLFLEDLEDRITPRGFTVEDPGDGAANNTLRHVLAQLRGEPLNSNNTIDFANNVRGNINLMTALPTINRNVVINGPGGCRRAIP